LRAVQYCKVTPEGVMPNWWCSRCLREHESSGCPKGPVIQKKPRTPSGAPDWTRKCTTCGATPVVEGIGLCGPCTFGEAATADGEW